LDLVILVKILGKIHQKLEKYVFSEKKYILEKCYFFSLKSWRARCYFVQKSSKLLH